MNLKSATVYSLLALIIIFPVPLQAQPEVAGLDGWSIFLDPGHSQTENMGLYNYSEPEKVLRVGLALREMLETQTDVDTVYMSRTSDSEQVSLTQRTNLANTVGADFYYSIHSNAGSSTTNTTLMLYGGWQEQGEVVEKFPSGGELMGDLLTEELTDAMRIPTIGNWADRTFYQGFVNHSNRYPYLHVNRESDMASVLSEGGFHTNPIQQQRNLNAEWKRLEAQAAFWSIIEYHEQDRPEVGIVTGYITEKTSGKLLNGITVTINGQSYITDTYESLFNEYSNDTQALRNGFYYIENLPNGITEVIVGGEGYYTDTLEVDVIKDNFTFSDIQLIPTESTSNEDEIAAEVPNSISLDQNYPNPFNPTTNILFGVPQHSEVYLEVYDMLGRKVSTIFSGAKKSAGLHTVSYDASELTSGVYLYRLTIGSDVISRKMLLMK